ncbi:DNA-directed RNA polymerase sigma-70 factor [Actinoplanes sp. NBRC 14428]|uniref:RNA polymerase sigma-70 factor (ECF subfamily) n=1 Tax=Pseudosporangium ferrugineum TaxID=439699 RepID=A0A2T0SBI6_9ACTN|nr:sigma-70 family RNA polymerase sigma factor [Pseudosporangium ferrugineum]PRY30683.1 RNA polymerase sigma-70 factor (ECF subfamily) [Pseudosporangium ferrugineum]BCJ50228.1 DNA-directed RNA polymerase sigma-70 factor [Actinoplanes sp. NBRC 14428]
MTEEQFRALFAANFEDVWSFVRRRVGTDADADDVTADTFSIAWRRREQVPEDFERPWLFRTAHNVLTNLRRSSLRERRLHLRIAAVDPPEVAYESVAEVDGVLWAALAALPRKDRDLLLMRAWDGLEVAGIAAVLGVSAATVSSRLYKARERLHREIARRDRPGGGDVQGRSHGKGNVHR